ncbi:LacI family DNA-binding transcriptional regulator [Novosphingobium aerophilum]|uniref:LacI family DNA-binding transcriptional regulator n=1 Tax=Novosphingobium TaxID=165696 RepID=UPI0006C85534|nr:MULTISPECIES: LacI family DNA-binding transcriptional regulator [unclassified Novosphingobium]KPH65352.1 LacI family transcriptional regulator [Novosphingobium sp. ST904]MPS68943.1 LacI family DNA-binding transcriptional regulator [Novosphingobium sp.]TCM30704.1 LacI family transcriptional regulator [Novosphingobium sp. ST904]WRT94790.1 LacI family DNA-binding transcriptional regulator [Novosphingobium sp. RL4]
MSTNTRGPRKQRSSAKIDDVARLAGVSPMTVSRVINKGANVREETRRKVEAAIAELNYAPSTAARVLAGGEDLRIGLLHSNPSFAYLSEFLVGALEETSTANAQLLVKPCNEEGAEAKAVAQLLRTRIDGVILPPPLSDSPAVLEALRHADVPVVAVATGRAPEWALSVSIDDREAAFTMTHHLAALGHRRIGFITGHPNQTASAERLDGYREALSALSLPFDPSLVAQGYFTYRSGLEAAAQLLDLQAPPTAIFASNDDMAAAAITVAHRRGLDVPGALTVCGFDDTALAVSVWPELTTIRQPTAEMARRAVRLLIGEIRSRNGGAAAGDHPHVVAEFKLIRRDSDAAPRA